MSNPLELPQVFFVETTGFSNRFQTHGCRWFFVSNGSLCSTSWTSKCPMLIPTASRTVQSNRLADTILGWAETQPTPRYHSEKTSHIQTFLVGG